MYASQAPPSTVPGSLKRKAPEVEQNIPRKLQASPPSNGRVQSATHSQSLPRDLVEEQLQREEEAGILITPVQANQLVRLFDA